MKSKKNDKIRRATALKYSSKNNVAPQIIASGQGIIAENIIKKAKESEVPLYEDAHLATILSTLNIGDEIPSELYEVVAQILVFVSELDKKYDL